MLSRKQWKIHKIDSCNKKAVTRIDKNDAKITKYVSYILLFIDGARFMPVSWLNLVNNLSERNYKTKCKYGHKNNKCQTCGIKYKSWDCFHK